nr:probable E3 ubiquitin-protein ligase RHG1A [Ipomoea batatas]
MQGQRSAIGSLPETLDFTRGPATGDGLDQPVCWNNLRSPAQNRLPDYIVSPNDASVAYITPTSQERQNMIGWTIGESSSSVAQSQVSENEPKTGHNWSSSISACPGPSCIPEERRFEPSNILSLNNVDVNLGSGHTGGRVLPMQGSSSGTLPRDLNRSSGMEEDDTDDDDDDDDDDCQVMEFITAYESGIPANERVSSGGSSSGSLGGSSRTGGYFAVGSDGRPGSSTNGRLLSCKRKALEGHAGQSSGSGSSSYFQHPESSVWNTAATQHNILSSSNIPSPAPNNSGVNLAEQINPRLGLSIGDAASESPVGLTAPCNNAESSRRNFRLRINASHQHQHQQGSVPRNLFSTETEHGNVSVSSSYRNSSRLHCNNSIEFRPTAIAESSNPQGQPIVVHVPSLRRHSQTRWNAASSSRSGNPANYPLSMDRDSAQFDESTSRAFPRNISQHPMFTPADIGNPSQNPTNWGLANGNNCVAGNLASTSRSGPTSGAHSSSPSLVPNRALPQYPRRLSEFVRRSLLTSAGADSGGQINNGPQLRASSSAGSPEMALPGNHGHRPSSSRSAMLLERHLDTSFAIPYSWRTLAAAGEGRSRLVSEIHNVLDLMRRGEGLRIEDVMILDQSVLFGMPDAHDRHRDMRLDVDNMSYEELLALEERIGNVCTGLSEEAISSRLKQHKYAFMKVENPEEREPCCVCQEEYNDGEDLGTLDCGHDFHADCIKQWLKHKNLCPICKTAGLAT